MEMKKANSSFVIADSFGLNLCSWIYHLGLDVKSDCFYYLNSMLLLASVSAGLN